MTISNQTRVATAIGNGAATVFPFSFPVFDSSHLDVRLYTRADNSYVTLSPSDYSVSGVGPASTGGSVTYNPGGVPIPSTKMLVIYRTLPYTQDTDIVNQSGFYPDVIETQLDKIVMQIQQLGEAIGRALLIPPTSAIDEEDFSALIIQLGGMLEELQTIADWISGGSTIATLDITGFVFATAGQTSIPVAGGYTPGTLEVRRNGIVQLQGTPIGTGDTDFDCSATDGLNILFPAAELDENDCISWTKKRNFDVANVAAEGVIFTPAGGIGSSNVQLALEELDSEKVPMARQITTSGLLTGGGALSTDRAFSVPKASTAECITGTDDAKAVTPLGLNAAVTAIGSTPAHALVASGTTTAVSEIDIPLTGGFREYELRWTQFEPVTAASYLGFRLSQDNGATYLAGATEYKYTGQTIKAAIALVDANAGAAEIQCVINQIASGSGNGSKGVLKIGMGAASRLTSFDVDCFGMESGPRTTKFIASGQLSTATARPTHLRIRYSAGNIAANGLWQLYGLRS